MNSLVKDALKLVIITVVAGLVLGAVYGITKKPIADQEAKAQMEAYKAVFPKASDFKDVDGFSEEAASKVIASYVFLSVSSSFSLSVFELASASAVPCSGSSSGSSTDSSVISSSTGSPVFGSAGKSFSKA